jgi:hypothetical protein
LSRAVTDEFLASVEIQCMARPPPHWWNRYCTTATDRQEAQAAIDRLAAVPTDPGFVLHELPLLRSRALLAHTRGDDSSFREFMGRYRDMATSLGFDGHIAWAEAMP